MLEIAMALVSVVMHDQKRKRKQQEQQRTRREDEHHTDHTNAGTGW